MPTNRPCSTTPGTAWIGRAERERVGDRREAAVEDAVALVGRERRAVGAEPEHRLRAEAPRPARQTGTAKPITSTGTGARSEPCDALRVVGDDARAGGRGGHDLLAQERAAEALDGREVRRDLVGAVEADGERRLLVEAAADADAARERGRGLGRRHADDVVEDALGEEAADRLGHVAGRGAGVEADSVPERTSSARPRRRPRATLPRQPRRSTFGPVARRTGGRRAASAPAPVRAEAQRELLLGPVRQLRRARLEEQAGGGRYRGSASSPRT